jgi:hypothetical protein
MPLKAQIPESLQTDEWARLPNPKGGRLLGFSRSTLLTHAEAGNIKIIRVKQPGRIRGVRLVWMPSLRSFLASLLDASEATPTPLINGVNNEQAKSNAMGASLKKNP